VEPFAGDARFDDTAIVGLAHAGDEAALFHAVEEASHVRIVGDHAITDSLAGQPLRFGATENAQHVVLGARETLGLEQLLGLLADSIRRPEKSDEDTVFEGEGSGSGLQAGAHSGNIVVTTIVVKRKIYGPDSRLAHRAQLDFAEKALRALGDDHGHGMGDVFCRKHFRCILVAATGKIGGHAAGANNADADTVFAQVFRHATGKALQAPFRSAIQGARSERVAACKRADVDNVTLTAANHGGNNSAGNQKGALEIRVHDQVPVGFRSLLDRAEKADAGVVEQGWRLVQAPPPFSR
jgi:hypothetical protein